MNRKLLTWVLIGAVVSTLSGPSLAMAQRSKSSPASRGSVKFAERGPAQADPGERRAFRAGRSIGRNQGYNRGYRRGYHRGVRRGVWAHPWAYRAPVVWNWHPFGWFVTTLAVTAVIVTVVDDDGNVQDGQGEVYYDEGVYYTKTDGGYEVIPPPPGAQIDSLPEGHTAVSVGDEEYSFYQGDFYVPSGDRYVVTAAPEGAIVPYVPDAATETDLNGTKYYEYNGVTYQAVSIGGQTSYLVTES